VVLSAVEQVRLVLWPSAAKRWRYYWHKGYRFSEISGNLELSGILQRLEKHNGRAQVREKPGEVGGGIM